MFEVYLIKVYYIWRADMICAFFGHRDCPDSIKSKLFETIKSQIEQGTTQFYVGNNGKFDAMVLSCLRELKKEYPEIHYTVVLAYIPKNSGIYQPEETIIPEGIEFVPKRFAIDFRNRNMVEKSDTVIAYVSRSVGGAAKYLKKAKNKGAKIINLAK